MHNRIEKSYFRPGEYVGYCDGVWHIKKAGDCWVARYAANSANYFRARTLDGIGKGLDERANIAVVRHIFRGD